MGFPNSGVPAALQEEGKGAESRMGFLRKRTAGGSTQAGQGCNPASAICGHLGAPNRTLASLA